MPSSLRDYIVAYDSAHPKPRLCSSSAPSSTTTPSTTTALLHNDETALSLSVSDSIPSCGDSILSPSPSSSTVGQDMVSLDGDTTTEPALSSNCRQNEHLAVLIARYLWKADNLATYCDKYGCRTRFGLLQRKHHCRKCGGVYCHACSSRVTPLLDTQKLPFHYPPPNKPISEFATPNAPVVNARVCDDCWDQIHGTPSKPISPSLPQDINISGDSCSPVSTHSPVTPPDIRPLFVRTVSSSPRRRPTWHEQPPVQTTKLEGDLDRYPLKDPSETCKAAGSGRWEPKQVRPRWDSRLPDGRLRYEVVADQREEALRQRNANPVIVDGEIRVRKPSRPSTPNRRSPCKLPTF